MLRFIVITFEILALVVIMRSAFVQYWLSDMQSATSDWMHELSLTLEKRELADFRDNIRSHAEDLNESQIEYLENITSTKVALTKFNTYYCHAGDKNPYIYGVNLQYICGQIVSNGILKELGS